MDGYQLGGGWERMGENVQGLRSTNWQLLNRQGGVKNNIRNGVTKEPICMTYGYELSGGLPERMRVLGEEANGENWDNCNSIINKICF